MFATQRREVRRPDNKIDYLNKLYNAEMLTVQTLLQVLVAWGITPYIEVIPEVIAEVTQGETETLVNVTPRVPKEEIKLFVDSMKCIMVLLKEEELYDLIVPSLVTPLAAGLLHLAYSPAMAIGGGQGQQRVRSPSDLLKVTTPALWVIMKQDKDWAVAQLNFLLDKVDPSDLVSSFMWIMKSQGDLKWLNQRCGQLLTAVLLRPNGLKATLLPLLSQSNVTTDHYIQVARLIATVPRQMQSVEKYYSLLSPQLLDLLMKSPDTNNLANHHVQTATLVVLHMLEAQPELTKKYILEVLLRPLAVFHDGVEGFPSVSEGVGNNVGWFVQVDGCSGDVFDGRIIIPFFGFFYVSSVATLLLFSRHLVAFENPSRENLATNFHSVAKRAINKIGQKTSHPVSVF
eukprot:TRINITY_DN5352_c0_g3_i22.p1 TRINITY_DN5352_c0_g3~~TRINITY_DN5352_c0_g3_i22.p1  ORF type:complete len:401 (+),score=66.68 TRINITY_DN5352_c0_g3_i22:356-1558(+)